jgi:hypothetical protein
MQRNVQSAEQNLNNPKPRGWNWSSFLLGPFWYLFNGMVGKGVVLLVIALITFGFGAPFVWFYCGLRGNSDQYERLLKEKTKFNIDKI